jgi:hypothetical protein
MQRLRPHAHGEVFAHWSAALEALYTGSVREFEPDAEEAEFVGNLVGRDQVAEAAAATLVARCRSVAPARIASLAGELVDACRRGGRDAPGDLRVLLRHLRANTIGAGLAFWSAALHTRPEDVTAERIACLEEVLALLDFRVRLANDASGLMRSNGRDRDTGKLSTLGVLVPEGAVGAKRVESVMFALRAGHRLSRRVDQELETAIARLCGVWPEMAAAVARGWRIGVAMYAGSVHYTSASAAQAGATLSRAS